MQDTVIMGRTINGSPPGLIVLTIKLDQDKDIWVGECLELGTATYASSVSELQEELVDAILLQLNEVERLGFIDEYLRDHQIKILPWPKTVAGTPSDHWNLVGAGI